MAREEKELLRRAREGDTVAFGDIVRRYQFLVYSSALQVVRASAAARGTSRGGASAGPGRHADRTFG